MSENIYQIFTSNPAATMLSTDLLYLGRSPYNTSDDFAITFANFVASIGTSTPTASTIVRYDANLNISANNFIPGFQSIATAAATTTLNVASPHTTQFTGSTTQTVLMPVVSTLAVDGFQYLIVNSSSGIVTVESSGGNTIQAMAPGSTLMLMNIAITGTTAASWFWQYIISETGNSFAYTSVSGTSQAATGNNAYILNNAAATTVTLPTSASSTIGDTIKIKGRSAAAWIIQANTSQIITLGGASSTSAGTATSAAGTDSLQLVYVASNVWSVDWALSTGITLA